MKLLSLVTTLNADGDGVKLPEAHAKTPSRLGVGGSAGVKGRGMHEETHTRTWETHAAPRRRGR